MMNHSKLIELANSTIISSALDLIGVNYSVIDVNGRYIAQNKSMETAISKGLILAESIDKPSWEDCKRVMLNRRRELKEEEFKGRYFLSLKQPLIENDTCIAILVISFDITDRKQAYIAKQEFLQNMAHDIRTPLSGVIGVAQLQEMGLTKDLEEAKEFGRMIHETGNQLLELLNTVINTIDTEHMTDPVKTEPLDLGGLARELQALFQPNLLTKQQLQLCLALDQQLPIVLTDRIKLKRILINILSNAIKFTKEGKITFGIRLLSVENNQANIEVTVTDTGIGIEQDKLDKIFDRFYRVHPSYLAEYEGYGVGLYAVKQTLELLKGQINVHSKLGQGTRFTLLFNFPLAHNVSDPITDAVLLPSPEAQTQSQVTQTATVLIAEDNVIACSVLKRSLEEAGYTVTATSDGEAALAILKSQAFDWALLDIGLPGLRGTEVCQQYRQWEKEQHHQTHLPVFALTGHAVSEVEDECKETGIDQAFTKPFTNKMLQEIENLLTID